MTPQHTRLGLAACILAAIAGCDQYDAADAVTGSMQTGKSVAARTQLKQFADALRARELAGQGWPDESQGLHALVDDGSIRAGDLMDPWDNEYVYRAGDPPTLLSLGPDGAEGTADDIVHEIR